MKNLTQKEINELLYLGGAIVLVILVFVLVKKFKNKKQTTAGATPSNSTTTKPTAPVNSADTFIPNRVYSVTSPMTTGAYVEAMQKMYNQIAVIKGFPLIDPDGKFGNGTANAMKRITGSKATTYEKVLEVWNKRNL